MDSLANYGSDGENSNNSEDTKMPRSKGLENIERRANDVNYDPVQMDMSEESNNNHSSGDSGSERAQSPGHERHLTGSRRDSSRHLSSPADQRRSDHESHSSNSRDDHKRLEKNDQRSSSGGGGGNRSSRDKSKSKGRYSQEDRKNRTTSDRSRDSRESKKSRNDERKSSRDEERRKKSSNSSKDDHRHDDRDKDHHYRDDRRDRDRERSDRNYRRDRDRRHQSRDEKTKERPREERLSRENKDKERTRSRSRSKERVQAQLNFRAMSYREEKGRNKLAQLEKLGIELKAPSGETIIPAIIGEPNYYNPLATATQGKYAEQIQKRKLLWANKSKPEEGKTSVGVASTANTWMGTTFTHDQDGKVTAKFKRLMGIKEDMPVTPQPGNKPDILKKQEEMFNNMEQQYEVARATTHTQRGVGLGYATGGYQFPR